MKKRETEMMNYKDAGVDVQKGEELVEKIKDRVRKSYGPEVVSGVGGFCSLYDLGGGRLLAAGTDGVGTKLKLAQELHRHNTIGIDLVAMCANDVLCCGARPLFFLDYFSCGVLDLGVADQVLEGIVEGCRQSKMPLMGGETAEMPGVYAPGEYDLAGFCVGEVHRDRLLDGRQLGNGDTLLGLASSGFHSNGFSLVRKLLQEEEGDRDLKTSCLTPTRIYVDPILRLLEAFPANTVRGMAHITGGGLRNILRINPQMGYLINAFPALEESPAVIREISARSRLSPQELFSTFNMGIGMVLAVDTKAQAAVKAFLRELGEKVFTLGEVGGPAGELKLSWKDKDEKDSKGQVKNYFYY